MTGNRRGRPPNYLPPFASVPAKCTLDYMPRRVGTQCCTLGLNEGFPDDGAYFSLKLDYKNKPPESYVGRDTSPNSRNLGVDPVSVTGAVAGLPTGKLLMGGLPPNSALYSTSPQTTTCLSSITISNSTSTPAILRQADATTHKELLQLLHSFCLHAIAPYTSYFMCCMCNAVLYIINLHVLIAGCVLQNICRLLLAIELSQSTINIQCILNCISLFSSLQECQERALKSS